jgi:hypothetical protein
MVEVCFLENFPKVSTMACCRKVEGMKVESHWVPVAHTVTLASQEAEIRGSQLKPTQANSSQDPNLKNPSQK